MNDMQTITDVHQQFAEFFESDTLKPFAYLVSKRLAEGHICVPLDDLRLAPEEIAYLDQFPVNLAKNRLPEQAMVASGSAEKQPFILYNNRLYLQRYFAYESSVLESIRRLVGSEESERAERLQLLTTHKDFIRSLSKNQITNPNVAIENTDWQQVAAICGVLNNFSIITGGPGTGKTTTVAKILAILYTLYPAMKVALAAPTGKAAVRMAESLNASRIELPLPIREKFAALEPTTIHRLLKYVPGSPYFWHDVNNPLIHDLVIVDEASMIDVALFAKLLAAIRAGTRIILLGDKEQLASVEAGSLFGDLCQSQQSINVVSVENVDIINDFMPEESQLPVQQVIQKNNILSGHITELKYSHRFTGAGGIGQFAKAVIQGRLETVDSFIDSNSYPDMMIDPTYADESFNKFISGYQDYIKEKDIARAIKKLNELRVLCAVREGTQGLLSVNRRIEAWLVKKGWLQNNTEFYEHRPIIVTRNYPELKLYNGDIGIIRPDENGNLKAWFEDGENSIRAVLPGYITSAETVFAMTIHKSQGSEYNRVLVLLPDGAEQPLLTRELLYTAITRAKEFVLIQASREAIVYTAGKNVQRASGIRERLSEMD